MRTFKAALWKQDNWYIAQCLDLELATQAGSEPEAIENMKEALALHLELPESELEVIVKRTPPAIMICAGVAEKPFRHIRFKLEAAGFRGISQKPNHAKFIKGKGSAAQTAVLPHYTELSVPVIVSIARQAGMPPDDFV